MAADKQTVKAGRIALRVEGDFWNAYWAREQTSMEGAILLGSIRMSIVSANPDRKADFMALMQAALSDQIIFHTGQEPTWTADRAPERERSGQA